MLDDQQLDDLLRHGIILRAASIRFDRARDEYSSLSNFYQMEIRKKINKLKIRLRKDEGRVTYLKEILGITNKQEIEAQINRMSEYLSDEDTLKWLVDKSVKAEFYTDSTTLELGHTLYITNHSKNAVTLGCDFGDGERCAIEGTEQIIHHTYQKCGKFTIHISAENALTYSEYDMEISVLPPAKSVANFIVALPSLYTRVEIPFQNHSMYA